MSGARHELEPRVRQRAREVARDARREEVFLPVYDECRYPQGTQTAAPVGLCARGGVNRVASSAVANQAG